MTRIETQSNIWTSATWQFLIHRSPKHLLGISSPSLQNNRHSLRGKRSLQVQAERDVDFADRAVGALPYFVPLFDGLKYGDIAIPAVDIGCAAMHATALPLRSRPSSFTFLVI